MTQLSQMIYKRKSHRAYEETRLVPEETLEQIRSFWKTVTPLYPDIRTEIVIHTQQDYLLTRPWAPRYAVSLYSEKKEGYLENAGFMLQQMDLFIQSIGLGSCWLGLSKPNTLSFEGELSFVMLICFGVSSVSLRESPEEFNRKELSKISDASDDCLEPARLAPSAINSQPWFFVHEKEQIRLFRTKPLLLKKIDYMSDIDSGIALAHLFVANPDSFRFLGKLQDVKKRGYVYMGSFTL